MKKRVVIAMSGGVDSSIAAHFLVKDGYDVIGLFMRLGDFSDETLADRKGQGCCSVTDSFDARSVADALGIHFYVLNFEKGFEKIVDYFCAEYISGRTPNPCIVCNQKLKFGKLIDFANALDADLVATGHYARVSKVNSRYILKKGIDTSKDQSYVLAHLNQGQLSRAIFPLGEIKKEEVRAIAKELDLKIMDKPESQEICFIPDNDYKNFIKKRAKSEIKPGILKDTQGNILGEHQGIPFFTIGQRRGLKIAFGKPMYVVDINKKNNEITIGTLDDLHTSELIAVNLNWVSIESLKNPIKALAKIRYSHTPVLATVYPLNDSVRVIVDKPLTAVTPGQAVVFYDMDNNDTVIGAGWIAKQLPIVDNMKVVS